MPQIRLSDTITLKNKEYPVSELTQSLAKLEPKKIIEFLASQNISGIARVRRIRLLKDVLFPYVVKTRQKLQSLASELNYRLSWFRLYSEYELENLLIYFNSKVLNRQYLDELWCLFLNVMKENNVQDADILKLVKQAEKSTYEPWKSIHEYNKGLWPLFKDPENVLDGLTPDEFRPVLFNSSTVKEIRELGKKYDVNVPIRLRKKQFIENIIQELKKRNEFDLEVEKQIEAKNVIQLERFCIDRKIPISSELKKEEIIEYILSHAAQTKGSYFVPEDHLGYDLTLEEVAKNQVETDTPELTTKQFDAGDIHFKEYVPVNFDEVDVDNSELSITNFDEEPATSEVIEEEKVDEPTVDVITEFTDTVNSEPEMEISDVTETQEFDDKLAKEPTDTQDITEVNQPTETVETTEVVHPTETQEITEVIQPSETQEFVDKIMQESASTEKITVVNQPTETVETTEVLEPIAAETKPEPVVIEEDSNLDVLTENTTEPIMPEEVEVKSHVEDNEKDSSVSADLVEPMSVSKTTDHLNENKVNETSYSDKQISETHSTTENQTHNITKNITTNYITNTKNIRNGEYQLDGGNMICGCQCGKTKYSDHGFNNMVINGGFFDSGKKVKEADEKEAHKVFSLSDKNSKKPRAIENSTVLPQGYYIQAPVYEDNGWFNRLLAFLVFLGLLIATVSFILLYFDVLKL